MIPNTQTPIANMDIFRFTQIEAAHALVHCALLGPAGFTTRFDLTRSTPSLRDVIGANMLPSPGVVVLPIDWLVEDRRFDFDLEHGKGNVYVVDTINEWAVLFAFASQSILQSDRGDCKFGDVAEFVQIDGTVINDSRYLKRLIHIWKGVWRIIQVNYPVIEDIEYRLDILTWEGKWDRRSRDHAIRLALCDDRARDMLGSIFQREAP